MVNVDEIFSVLEEKFGATKESKDKWTVTAVVPAAYLHNAVQFLRDESAIKFEMLVDIAGVDYLTYPNHEGPRFAVDYAFKSMSTPGARIRLKVQVPEADLNVPTLTDLYANANWYEREWNLWAIRSARIILPRSVSGSLLTTTCSRPWKSVWKSWVTG